MSIAQTVIELTDLRFQEDKIRNSSAAIASGFSEIHTKQLWRAHPNGYQSFKEYCIAEWASTFGFSYIQELTASGNYCHTLEATVTESAQANAMPLPSSSKQLKALKGAPGTIEDQAQLWESTLDEAGGNPDDVTVQSLKDKIAQMVQLSQSEFPLGCAVRIETDNDRIVFNGYRGYVVGYNGKSAAKVIVKLPDGTTTDEMDICLNWLVPLDEPPMPMPEPEEKPVKQSLSDRHKVAIALLQRVADEGVSMICGDISEFLEA